MQLILIHGANGAGKTSVTTLLHEELPHMVLVRGDELRHMINDYRAADQHARPLRDAMTTALTRTALSAGYSVVVEQLYHNRKELNQLRKLGEQYGASIHEFFLIATPSVIKSRLAEREFEDNSLLDEKKALQNLNELESDEVLQGAATRIDTSNLSARQVATQIILDVER